MSRRATGVSSSTNATPIYRARARSPASCGGGSGTWAWADPPPGLAPAVRAYLTSRKDGDSAD